MSLPPDLLEKAIQAAREGRRSEAREMLLKLVEADEQNEAAWIWLTGLVDELEDKIIACENVLTLNPGNERVRAYLNQLLLKQRTPEAPPIRWDEMPAAPTSASQPSDRPSAEDGMDARSLARQYEAEGRLEEARQALIGLASTTKDSRVFDEIYGELSRLEALQQENLTRVSPALSIARLTCGWPLLYLALALVQSGLNPIAHPSWFLLLGLPPVAAGSFLLAIAENRARNPFWKAVFAEENGSGSDLARTRAFIGGWMLVILPHVLMLAEAVNRLQNFQIPPFPHG